MQQRFLHQDILSKFSSKVTNVLGYFFKQFFCQELSKIDQSGRTGRKPLTASYFLNGSTLPGSFLLTVLTFTKGSVVLGTSTVGVLGEEKTMGLEVLPPPPQALRRVMRVKMMG